MSEIELGGSDGVEDAVGEDLRLGLLVASQLAERISSRIAESKRHAENMAERGAQEARAELEGHRSLARGATQGVDSDRWWQEVSPAQIASTWTLASGWEGQDEQMSERAEVMRQGLMDRYGITDPDNLTMRDLVEAQRDDQRAGQVAGPVNDAEWEAEQYGKYEEELRAQREGLNGATTGMPFTEGPQGGPERQEWVREQKETLHGLEDQAGSLSHEAQERADRLRGQGATPTGAKGWDKTYDTAERRGQLREQLREAGVPPEAANAKVLSDTAQGRPARDAVRGDHAPAKARRRKPQFGRNKQAQRGR